MDATTVVQVVAVVLTLSGLLMVATAHVLFDTPTKRRERALRKVSGAAATAAALGATGEEVRTAANLGHLLHLSTLTPKGHPTP